MITTKEHLYKRIVRLNEMVPCTTAFIDARTPGSDKKENFCLIGGGVAENPDQVVHINIPHGFNVGAARQPKGCKNSHHSHDTEEVFMIFSGSWEFTWGESGDDGSTVLNAGDTISLPRHMFRGFENVSTDDALMFAILGLDDLGSAGKVLWAPYVFTEAKNHGLILLEDGRLIDTAAGKPIPIGGIEQRTTSPEQVAALTRLNAEDMQKCVLTQAQLSSSPRGGLSAFNGVDEIAVIGSANSKEAIAAGKMDWKHGFHMRRLVMKPSAKVPAHTRAEEEVLIVHSGSVNVKVEQANIQLNAGDLFSIPIEAQREFINTGSEDADLIVIRRGDQPQAAQFIK